MYFLTRNFTGKGGQYKKQVSEMAKRLELQSVKGQKLYFWPASQKRAISTHRLSTRLYGRTRQTPLRSKIEFHKFVKSFSNFRPKNFSKPSLPVIDFG